MNWLCWLIGHKWDGAPDQYYEVCSRCGACPYYNYGDDSWHIEKMRDSRFRVQAVWTDFRFWLMPCPHCGCRFYRHTEDCVPF